MPERTFAAMFCFPRCARYHPRERGPIAAPPVENVTMHATTGA
jgi:hypothetical protein